MLERGTVEHDSRNIYFRSVAGAAETGSRMRLGLEVRGEEPGNVLLHLWQNGSGERILPLSLQPGQEGSKVHFYSLELEMPEKGCLLWYYFIITAEGRTFYYGNNPEQLGGIGELYDHVPPAYQITVYEKGAKTPEWFKHSIVYQIFPDRFCREGNEIIRKKNAVYHACWEDDPLYCREPDSQKPIACDFFGGNLKGIESKLPYLKELGISAICLNPIFESESSHHYDTGDYHRIDPILGTDEDFRHLVLKAKKLGIRILLEGVFSHTGSNSRYFNREGLYDSVGAYQSKDSPYYGWYRFRRFPEEYDTWWNNASLPNVRKTDASYMDFIIHGRESVLHHWMSRGICGWRLNVMDELPAKFSRAFYKELKTTDPNAVLIGEVWEDASNKVSYNVQREYLCGGEMDSAMNYPFRQHVMDFLLGRTDGATCRRRLESLRENYPKENFYAMMNLLSSHDVQRAITLLGEAPCGEELPMREQSRYRLDKEHYTLGRKRLFLAVLWQMTYPGVPCIYYGDEIGMEGFKEPFNRRSYPWGGGDDRILEGYRRCISERNGHTALQTGDFLPLFAEGDVIAYARVIKDGRDAFGNEAENDAYIVAINRNKNEARHISLNVSEFADGVFVSLMEANREVPVIRGRVDLKLEPLQGCLLRKAVMARKYARRAGVLLHPTSLPSSYGIGDFGEAAYRFVDFLAEAGQSVWQILPLGPVAYGNSPYQSPSAFAGNPMLIDLDDLVERGWLKEKDVKVPYVVGGDTVDFDKVWEFKRDCIRKAYEVFRETAEGNEDYQGFCKREAYWLDDYALFHACKKEFDGQSWTKWLEPVRRRKEKALADMRGRLGDSIGLEMFMQYLFDAQWHRLRAYAHSKGIRILGDMPIFISHDSADVWAHQSLFDLHEDGTPKTVAGVPPDYFSATGQLWGNPQYDWKAMKEENYSWWKSRFKKLYEMVDLVRIDHFRGFEAYWEVDGKAQNAMNGQWRSGPGEPFFRAIREELGELPIVAEDLGVITDAVEELRAACDFPGMKVLHFTLYPNEQGRMDFVAPENSIVYTGTHDNNTTVGWYEEDLDDRNRYAVAHMLHADYRKPEEVCGKLVEFAYASDARMAIVPVQDLLHLDGKSRMNVPGTVGRNWGWCLKPGYQQEIDTKEIRALCEKYERINK